jgi:hypothetical protein
MILNKNINLKNESPAPECSGSPKAIKAIFSSHNKATAGSSCYDLRKKAFITRAKAKSWNRLKNKNI